MKFLGYALSFALLTGAFTEVGADVFSLWPFSRKSSSGTGQEIPEQKKLWDETVEINGLRLNLTLSIVDADIRELIERMKKRRPAPRIHPGPDSTLIVIPLGDDKQRKILLVHAAPGTLLAFTMELPVKLPKTFTWPRQIPLPAGAEMVNYMYFAERDSYFGSFMVGAEDSDSALNDIKTSLESSGWKALGQKASGLGGTGEVFYRANPPGMAISAFSPGKDKEQSRGTIYIRPLK